MKKDAIDENRLSSLSLMRAWGGGGGGGEGGGSENR